MLRLAPVSSLDDPALDAFRSLRRPEAEERAGRFIAEGPNVVARLFASGLPVESLLCTAEWLARFRPTLDARPDATDVFVLPESELRRLVGFHLSNGVLAAARVPASPTVAELLAAPTPPAWWAALDGLSSSENVGAIVRSAVAFGAGAILRGETTASPWLRRAVRVSMGAMFAVPVLESRDLAGDLRALAAAGVRTLSLEADRGRPLGAENLRGPTCLVFGSEGTGARAAVQAACAARVTIPMPGGFDSLNVAAAAAVAGYEVARQRAQPRP